MRNRFAQKITQLAKEDDRLVLLSGILATDYLTLLNLRSRHDFSTVGLLSRI